MQDSPGERFDVLVARRRQCVVNSIDAVAAPLDRSRVATGPVLAGRQDPA